MADSTLIVLNTGDFIHKRQPPLLAEKLEPLGAAVLRAPGPHCFMGPELQVIDAIGGFFRVHGTDGVPQLSESSVAATHAGARSTFPPALRHGAIESAFEDVFFVTGTARFAAGITVSRAMTILRDGGNLTLVNSVRLDDCGLVGLDALGMVKNIVRLGGLHSVVHGWDDPFYKHRYPEATVWTLPGVTYDGLSFYADRILADGSMPMPRLRLLTIPSAKLPEALLLLEHAAGNILISGDPLQNFGPASDKFFTWLGARANHAFGFMKNFNVGPGFLM